MSEKRGKGHWVYGFLADEELHKEIQAFRKDNGILGESEALRLLIRKGVKAMRRDAELVAHARLQALASEELPTKKGAWTA